MNPSVFIFLQSVQDSLPITPIASLGVGGALALIMFWFYRLDRKASEERFTEISKDFRAIVQENTAAMVRLGEVIDRVISERR